MSFANPEAFFLFGILGFAIYFYFRVLVRGRSRLIFSQSRWLKSRPRHWIPTPFRFQGWLRPLALVFLIIGLARPQHVFHQEKRTVEAIDMIICFDLSKSMDAIDFKPDRRTVALKTISSFIDRRPDDRIGLVLFSGEAFLAVPPTVDHEFVKNSLNDSSNQFLQDGTAIGQAIAVATNHLKESRTKSRLIILVTDGDNNMGSVDPVTAAELAKGFQLKVHTVAIGSRGRVAYPVKRRDVFGRETQEMRYLTDAINEDLLQNIATMTGGQFFRATEDDVLQKIFDQIDRLEKTKVETTTLVRITERAWGWILAGLILLLIEGLGLQTIWRKLP